MKKTIMFMGSALFACFVQAAATVSNVAVRQHWPWSNKVDIDFVLEDSEGETHDVSLVLKNGTKMIAYSRTEVIGALENLAPGTHRLTWNPSGVDQPVLDSLTATVEVDDDPKKYLILDLTGGYSANEPIPYIWAAKEPVGGWFQGGSDLTYRGAKMVFRHIKAGSFVMGSPGSETGRNATFEAQRSVTLTKDFYIGILPLTYTQVMNVYGSVVPMSGYAPSSNAVLSFVSMQYLRGTNCMENWPAVDDNSVSGAFNRRLTALTEELPGYSFDVPTAAQWEYACRADTTTAHYNNTEVNTLTDPNPGQRNTALYDPGLEGIAIYKYNTKLADGTQTNLFCKLAPNEWGLYHMLGGPHWEMIRDGIAWNGSNLNPGPIVSADGECTKGSRSAYFWGRGGESIAECGACRAASWKAIANGIAGRGSFQGYNSVRMCLMYKGE
ncbi:MAG TPA: SUMF1/EgtB/PvdO family nonheme iron enzyme [Kiritimatiellia bacterium]|nr:SUMF1/EgtB/PvdO family nonheme iron enzyme [Kiritimatiellia bacterium]